ncbi:MAG: hypothetical protein U9R79_15560 [Armatimonadota bacterium]|nr:hypothetical protein [Armatimonadota bacterium]
MDYPDHWKDKLADEEERKRIAREHWRPSPWHVLALLAVAAAFAIAFWPGGCGTVGQ